LELVFISFLFSFVTIEKLKHRFISKLSYSIITKMLSDTQKKEAEDILTNYKKAYVCKVCGIIFGSDLKIEDDICPRCNLKVKKKVEKTL
jgi:rubrerythrin